MPWEVQVAHVEFSLSDSFGQPLRRASTVDAATEGESCPLGPGLQRWSGVVAGAQEPCLVIDVDGRIVAASQSCHDLLGMGDPADTPGQYLLDGVRHLVDFTAARNGLPEADIDAIPPLLALTSGRQTRGLLRVHDGDYDVTVDGIAVPLREGDEVVGSLTFFSAI